MAMMLGFNETTEQRRAKNEATREQFAAQNEAFRLEHAAIEAERAARITVAPVRPISLIELADQISREDKIIRRNGRIVNDF